MKGDNVQLVKAKHVNDANLKDINELLTTVNNSIDNSDHVGDIAISWNTVETTNTSTFSVENLNTLAFKLETTDTVETVNTSVSNLETAKIVNTVATTAEYTNMLANNFY